ncbi:MAG: hypothetical protein NVSMB53_17140 [Gemmatimonadaceae bacterium]
MRSASLIGIALLLLACDPVAYEALAVRPPAPVAIDSAAQGGFAIMAYGGLPDVRRDRDGRATGM